MNFLNIYISRLVLFFCNVERFGIVPIGRYIRYALPLSISPYRLRWIYSCDTRVYSCVTRILLRSPGPSRRTQFMLFWPPGSRRRGWLQKGQWRASTTRKNQCRPTECSPTERSHGAVGGSWVKKTRRNGSRLF